MPSSTSSETRGSRWRFLIFWLLRKVVITTAPSSSTPNHIGMGCGTPSLPMELMTIVWEPATKLRSSSSVMRI